jgi:hypothetical protein
MASLFLLINFSLFDHVCGAGRFSLRVKPHLHNFKYTVVTEGRYKSSKCHCGATKGKLGGITECFRRPPKLYYGFQKLYFGKHFYK